MSKSVISNNFLQVLESNNGITSVDIKNNHFLRRISGTHDVNFFVLEKISSTNISLRGNLITIKGNKENINIVISVINNLLKKSLDKTEIDEEDIQSVYNFISKDSNNKIIIYNSP